jgi:acyl dehydratase/YHS domain-containing protein
MEVEATGHRTASYEGNTYHFCSGDCRDFFVEHPDRFIRASALELAEIRDNGHARVPHIPGRARGTFEHDIANPTNLSVGDSITFRRDVTESDVQQFAEATGDTNALHLNEAFAKQTRFGHRIAHGTLVSGLISAALACFPGLTIYLSQQLEFQRAVDIGETLTTRCEIVEALERDRYRVTTRIENDAGEIVIHGTATVLIDEVPDV